MTEAWNDQLAEYIFIQVEQLENYFRMALEELPNAVDTEDARAVRALLESNESVMDTIEMAELATRLLFGHDEAIANLDPNELRASLYNVFGGLPISATVERTETADEVEESFLLCFDDESKVEIVRVVDRETYTGMCFGIYYGGESPELMRYTGTYSAPGQRSIKVIGGESTYAFEIDGVATPESPQVLELLMRFRARVFNQDLEI